jgi:hypothetical protein
LRYMALQVVLSDIFAFREEIAAVVTDQIVAA